MRDFLFLFKQLKERAANLTCCRDVFSSLSAAEVYYDARDSFHRPSDIPGQVRLREVMSRQGL